MNLFIIHSFPDLDNLAPIINFLSKKKSVLILSVYPIHDFKKYKILSFLIRQKVNYKTILDLSFKHKIFGFFLKIFLSLPDLLLDKLNFVWNYFYYNSFLFNEDLINNLNKDRKLTSINIDDALPNKYKIVLTTYSKKNEIPLYLYKSGVDMRREKNQITNSKNEFVYNDYGYCSKIIIQDNHHIVGEEHKTYREKVVKSCHRYSYQWINYSENAYDIKFDSAENLYDEKKKLRIVIFTTNSTKNKWDDIYKNIKNLNYVEVKIVKKPRGKLKPLHLHKNSNIEHSSSELINWSDIVISHSTSLLVEAVIKNKKILFMEYLSSKKEDLIIDDYDFIEKIFSDNHLNASIQNFKNNGPTNFINKEHLLLKMLGKNYKDNKYLEKFVDKLYN